MRERIYKKRIQYQQSMKIVAVLIKILLAKKLWFRNMFIPSIVRNFMLEKLNIKLFIEH
jgi:hypothetical protein